MKLHRLAIATFEKLSAYKEGIGLPIGSVHVQARALGEDDAVKNMLFVHAECTLTDLPYVDADGWLIIPEMARRQCEAAIQHLADMVAISLGTERSVASMPPHVALADCSEDQVAAFERARGIRAGNARGFPTCKIDLYTPGLAGLLGDRLVGVHMLAEAVSSKSPSAQYLELVRLFENAFQRPVTRLPKILYRFLASGEGGYERDEVTRWCRIRNAYFHADERAYPEVDATELRLVLARMRQAAYDTLFNKAEWHVQSAARRDGYTFAVQTTNRNAIDFYLTQGKDVQMLIQVLDPFGVFPWSFGPQLKSLPETWWAPKSVPPEPPAPPATAADEPTTSK